MKGLPEPQARVVQMMTELMKQSAEKCLELYDLGSLCGSHPNRYLMDPILPRLVKAVELAGLRGRTPAEHLHAKPRDAKGLGQPVHQGLRGLLGACSVSVRESPLQSVDQFSYLARSRQAHPSDLVDLEGDSLLLGVLLLL